MSAKPVCPVCENKESRLFKEWESMTLYSCGGCGTIYLFPLPSEEELKEIYSDLYSGATEEYFSKVEKKMTRSRRRMRALGRLVTGRRFLDVGSNAGFMVEAAREAGFDATGVELDPVSARYAREHYPQNTFIDGRVEGLADREGEGFDLIYSSEVIEHTTDPNGFVAAIAKLLRPKGVLFITTPDITHWRRPRKVEEWDGFDPPNHCLYFSPKSLAGLLGRHGLVVEKKMWAFKPGMKMVARKPA